MHVVLCLAFLTNVQPTTGYYDAALGYQTTGPATSLGANRGDALSGVQGVQGVQGAYTSISDARFARNDSNASPVPSTMSQQVRHHFIIENMWTEPKLTKLKAKAESNRNRSRKAYLTDFYRYVCQFGCEFFLLWLLEERNCRIIKASKVKQ